MISSISSSTLKKELYKNLFSVVTVQPASTLVLLSPTAKKITTAGKDPVTTLPPRSQIIY